MSHENLQSLLVGRAFISGIQLERVLVRVGMETEFVPRVLLNHRHDFGMQLHAHGRYEERGRNIVLPEQGQHARQPGTRTVLASRHGRGTLDILVLQPHELGIHVE